MDSLLILEENFIPRMTQSARGPSIVVVNQKERDDLLTFAVKLNRLLWRPQIYAPVQWAVWSWDQWAVADENTQPRGLLLPHQSSACAAFSPYTFAAR